MREQVTGTGGVGAEPAAQAVAGDGRSHVAADGEGHARRGDGRFVQVPAPQHPAPRAASMSAQSLDLTPLVDPADQADRRVRPLSRLALMMERPARVRIRARNPCLRARRRVFGWKVRFTYGSGHVCRSNGGGQRAARPGRARCEGARWTSRSDPPRLRAQSADRQRRPPDDRSARRRRRYGLVSGVTRGVVASIVRLGRVVHRLWTSVWIWAWPEGRTCR